MNRLSKNEEKMREMLNSQQFEYDPKHWEAAEKMLPKKGIFGFTFKTIWLTLPLLLVSAGFNYWLSPETITNSETVALAQNNISTNSVETQKGVADNSTANGSKKESSQDNAFNNPTAITKNGKNTSNTEASNTSNKKSTSKSIATNNYRATEEYNTPSKPKDAENEPTLNKPTTKNTDADNQSTIPEKTEETKQSNKPESTTSNKPENNTTPIEDKADKPLQSDANLEKKKENKKEGNQNNAEEPKQIFLKNSVSVVVAANYSRLIQPIGNSYISAPYFGIQYQRLLSTKWQLNTGIAYTIVQANALSKQYNKEQYSFGLTQEQINIATNRLHYLELPLIAKYKALNNLSVVGGANLSYLLTTDNTIKTNSSTTLGGKTFGEEKGSQYRRGINSFDVQMQFGLEYKLNTNLHLGILTNTGLTDVSKNNYYNTTVFNRNSRLQLYIKYDFIRF